MSHGDDPKLHVIRDGRFICLGDESSACHQYPDCECEEWSEEHDRDHKPVTHATCWQWEWITASDLEDSYDFDAPPLMSDTWPDGGVVTTWQGDYLTWEYADTALVTTEESR